MKKYIALSLIAGLAMTFGSCKKEGPNIFNQFTGVQIEFHTTDPNDVKEGEQTINVTDQPQIDYTITSDQDMYGLVLIETGTTTGIKIPVSPTERRKKSGIQVLPVISRTGPISYRLYATDKTGFYLGDGYKQITLNVVNDYTFLTERYAELPNPTIRIDSAKGVSTTDNYKFIYPASIANYTTTSQSFFSLSEAKAYTYTDAAANSAKIDFGMYSKPVVTITKNATTGALTYAVTSHLYFYTPGMSPSPLPVAGTEGPTGFEGFSFTGWTPKGTLFSAAQANTVFSAIKTGQQIAAGAAKVAVNLTNPEFVAGSANYFKTADGKYGMIWAHDVGSDRTHPRPYINFWVKMQL